jgi:hypothetical protein
MLNLSAKNSSAGKALKFLNIIDEYTRECLSINVQRSLKAQDVSENTFFAPGGVFSLCGSKIKAAGDDPGCGVFFVPAEDPPKAVKVNRLVENTPSKIIGKAPGIG